MWHIGKLLNDDNDTIDEETKLWPFIKENTLENRWNQWRYWQYFNHDLGDYEALSDYIYIITEINEFSIYIEFKILDTGIGLECN